MRTREARGSKNPKILRTSYLEAPLPVLAVVLIGEEDEVGGEDVGLFHADHDVEVALGLDKVLHGDALQRVAGHGEAGALQAARVLEVRRRNVPDGNSSYKS